MRERLRNAMSKYLLVWQMLGLIALMTMLSFLSACSTPIGNCSALTLIEYDNAFKTQLNAEVFASGPTTRRFVRESIGLRDEVRKCKGIAP